MCLVRSHKRFAKIIKLSAFSGVMFKQFITFFEISKQSSIFNSKWQLFTEACITGTRLYYPVSWKQKWAILNNVNKWYEYVPSALSPVMVKSRCVLLVVSEVDVREQCEMFSGTK
jgi:hypothetical protein